MKKAFTLFITFVIFFLLVSNSVYALTLEDFLNWLRNLFFRPSENIVIGGIIPLLTPSPLCNADEFCIDGCQGCDYTCGGATNVESCHYIANSCNQFGDNTCCKCKSSQVEEQQPTITPCKSGTCYGASSYDCITYCGGDENVDVAESVTTPCNEAGNKACCKCKVSGCSDECSPLGKEERACSSTKVQKRTCGKYDTDSCLEWSSWQDVEDCNSKDGWYDTGNTRIDTSNPCKIQKEQAYRDYSCSNEVCGYISSSVQWIFKENSPDRTSCGICKACSSGSCSATPADDANCGAINYDVLDTTCRNYFDITSNKCEGFGECKDADTTGCTSYTDASSSTTCGTKDCAASYDDYCSNSDLCKYSGSCTKYCSGAGSCNDCSCSSFCNSCGTANCPADYCSGLDFYDYPATCTNLCYTQIGDDNCGTCSCTATKTTCQPSGCCDATCSATGGCGLTQNNNKCSSGICGSDCTCTPTACYSAADCHEIPDNTCTTDSCINPGTMNSYCTHTNIVSSVSCGTCKQCDGSGNCINRPDNYNDCGNGCQRCISGSCQDYNAACSGIASECYCSNDVCNSCPDSYTCSNYQCTAITTLTTTQTQKDMAKYSDKMVFLVSDENWQDILSLVPITLWTNADGSKTIHPLLIYHEERNGFDADSIIYFMQQYKPDKVTIIGNTPRNLDNLLIAAPETGAGLRNDQLLRINILPENYFSYWSSISSVVIVDYNNYDAGLMASVFASYINAPVLFLNSNNLNSYKNMINGRRVYIIDNLDFSVASYVNSNAREVINYPLSELQKEYVKLTDTDKIILVNPDDLNIKVSESFIPDKSVSLISEIYSKTSLAAPILASAKNEVILAIKPTNYKDVNPFIKNKINELKIDAKYLTIVAAPNVIQMSAENEEGQEIMSEVVRDALDPTVYSNLDDDVFPELSTGRIFGITISDVSSYVGRDLFYDALLPNSMNILFIGKDFPSFENSAYMLNNVFSSAGYTTTSFVGYPTANENEWKNKQIIIYMDHGSTDWAGISSSQIPLLSDSFVVADACLTCAFDKSSIKKDLFCSNIIRKGGIGFIGAVDFGERAYPKNLLFSIYAEGKTIGEAFKEINTEYYVYGYFEWDEFNKDNYVLIGDPTLRIKSPFILPTTDIHLIEENSNVIKYEIKIKAKFFLYDKNTFEGRETRIDGGSADITTQPEYDLGTSGLETPVSDFYFKLGPFPTDLRVENTIIEPSDIYTRFGTDKNKAFKPLEDVNGGNKFLLIEMHGYEFKKDIVKYDNAWHDVIVKLTLIKEG